MALSFATTRGKWRSSPPRRSRHQGHATAAGPSLSKATVSPEGPGPSPRRARRRAAARAAGRAPGPARPAAAGRRRAVAAVIQALGQVEPGQPRGGASGSTGSTSGARDFHSGHWPSRPASTAVTTRWRGGIGGAWWTTPMRARSRVRSRGASHGALPEQLDPPAARPQAGRQHQQRVSCRPPRRRSGPPARPPPPAGRRRPAPVARVAWVKPTPSGVNCSIPLNSKAGRNGAGWNSAPPHPRFTQQARRMGRRLDALVVLGLGRDELAGRCSAMISLWAGLAASSFRKASRSLAWIFRSRSPRTVQL